MTTSNLAPKLSLASITFYGIGTIIGAGIYVLIGKVGGQANIHLPLSFLIAGGIALFTALSYGELAARFPYSAGSALYVHEAFKKDWLAKLVGLMVALTGIVSAAAISNGFVGYLNLFLTLPDSIAIIGLILLLTLIACWGIEESAWVVTLVTLLEVGGLVYVAAVTSGSPSVIDWQAIWWPQDFHLWSGVLIGSFLAFYAFVGFEDMVNVAEEVKRPERNLPIAIVTAIIFSTALYVTIAVLAVLYMPIDELTSSKAPLADMVKNAGHSTAFIGIISLFAVVNGALVQVIMASRLSYGMARRGLLPEFFGHINARTQTPIKGTLVVAVLLLIFALWLPLTALAKITSMMMLMLFSMVNFSLIKIKRQQRDPHKRAINLPLFIPYIGFTLCAILICIQVVSWFGGQSGSH